MWHRQKNINFILNSISVSQSWSPRQRPARVHFEVLGLGLDSKVPGLSLQAYKFSKMPCLRSRTALILICKKWAKVMTVFFSSSWRTRQRPCGKFMKTFFFWKTIACFVLGLSSSIPVLGLERVDPWPRIVLWTWPRALCPWLYLCYYFFNIHLNR